VRLTFAQRSVDEIDPPYPYAISPIWAGLPPTLNAGVEWIQAGSASLDIQLVPTCQKVIAWATRALPTWLACASRIALSGVVTGTPSTRSTFSGQGRRNE
jgi:hypothetical protein